MAFLAGSKALAMKAMGAKADFNLIFRYFPIYTYFRPQSPGLLTGARDPHQEEPAMAHELRTLVECLKAVAHPLRLRVLSLLEPGELCVCQIAETLQVPQSSVSEALRELRRAGFVVERKDGRWVFMSLVPQDQATPFLRGLLGEAAALPEVQQDRTRAQAVKALAIPVVCSKIERETSSRREIARV